MAVPIVVIAQIKNEERSLPRFLQTCETFADNIILLDQASTDQSVKIATSYSRVSIFNNPDRHLNEAHTIARLYELARSEVPGEKVILRLDADEALTANAVDTEEWKTIRTSPPGTVIRIPRIELLSFDECYIHSIIDRGYIDDGRHFDVAKIHANSTPIASRAPTLTCHRIGLLHYSGLRRSLGEAKMRYYCMLDNVYGTRPVFERRLLYRQGHILDIIRSVGKRVEFNEDWISGYESQGIDMTSVFDDQSTWHDEACLDLMIEHGSERFHLDPIWYHDWENVIPSLPADKRDVALAALKRPSSLLRKISAVAERLYRNQRIPANNKLKAALNSYFASA